MIRGILLLICTFTLNVQANSFCFAQAQRYYEQLYCEVIASGKGRLLPPFNEFKKNEELTQALLLKRPAQAAGLRVKLPGSSNSNQRRAAAKPRQNSSISTQALPDCELAGRYIVCVDSRYQLVGNRNNRTLSPDALTEENLMGLAVSPGTIASERDKNQYLHSAYRRYLEKMLDIGLGGVTMTYGKFAFLFDDLAEKGVDFSQRFETMYSFLKKDKRAMAVDEKVRENPALTLKDCARLDKDLFICSQGGRNFLFLRTQS